MKNKRFSELDLLRGFAVAGMIVFHAFYVLDFYSIVQNEMYEGWFLILVRSVQVSFVGLVGVSLALSYLRNASKGESIHTFRTRHIKRGLLVIGLGFIITLVTMIFIPDRFVRFGILHMLGVGIIFFAFFAHKKYLSLALSIGFALATLFLKGAFTYSGALDYAWYAAGLSGFGKGNTIDYFPILPWFTLISFSVFFGHLLYEKNPQRGLLNCKTPSTILFLSKYSLIIYLIHVPLIIIILLLLDVLRFEMILR